MISGVEILKLNALLFELQFCGVVSLQQLQSKKHVRHMTFYTHCKSALMASSIVACLSAGFCCHFLKSYIILQAKSYQKSDDIRVETKQCIAVLAVLLRHRLTLASSTKMRIAFSCASWR